MNFQPSEPASISDPRNPGGVLVIGVKMQGLELTTPHPHPWLLLCGFFFVFLFFFFLPPWTLAVDPVETEMSLLGLAEMQER